MGAAALTMPLVIATGVVTTAGPADADGVWTQHVAGTGTDGLYVHTDAGLAAPTTVVLAENTELLVDCVGYADTVGGTDPAWLHIISPVDGWVSDYYVDTMWSNDNTLPQQGLLECGGAPADDPAPVTGVDEVPTIPAPYDRATAAQWALDHAADIQPVLFPGCTWFVSQALWAGGLPQTPVWNGSDHHGRLGHLPGTIAATAVDEFISNLMATYPLTTQTPLDADRFRGNSVPEAEVGDVIAYDWENDGSYDHLALVTGIADGNYPEVSEWGTTDAREGHFSASYASRGWTWSQNDQAWLQDPGRAHPTPNVTARLFHVETVVAPTF
jgi:hypothetical protein